MFSSPDNDPTKRYRIVRLLAPGPFELLLAAALFSALFGLYLYAGSWPPVAAVVGDSMFPHMHDGDLVLLQSADKAGLRTAQESQETGYRTYEGYGDVIVFRPDGRTDVRPVIHRAMYWVNASEPIYPGGPLAPHAGYVTLGDNNKGQFDQYDYTRISPSSPIKKEWVIGVAKYNVPYIGWLRTALPW